MIGGIVFAAPAGSHHNVDDFSVPPIHPNQSKAHSRHDSVVTQTLDDIKRSTTWNKLWSNVPFIACTTYGLWIVLGVFWYKYYMNWTFATAFYYAMEAGLSIGFCNPAEKDDNTKAFTIIYVLLGSSVVSGAIGYLATYLIESKLSKSTISTIDYKFSSMSWRDHEDKLTLKSVSSNIWYKTKYISGWYSNRSRTLCVIVFIFWMGLGTIYGMLVEKWTFITALYWSVTSCSTGGLQSPECKPGTDGITCDLGDFRGSVMGVYFMLGVPSKQMILYLNFIVVSACEFLSIFVFCFLLMCDDVVYAVALGQFAFLVIEFAATEHQRQRLAKPITESEFLYAANILSETGSTTLVLGEFIFLELMRLGQTNQRQIELIKSKFMSLDKKKIGVLDMDDMRATGHVVANKIASFEKFRKFRTRSFEMISSITVHRKRGEGDNNNEGGTGTRAPSPKSVSNGNRSNKEGAQLSNDSTTLDVFPGEPSPDQFSTSPTGSMFPEFYYSNRSTPVKKQSFSFLGGDEPANGNYDSDEDDGYLEFERTSSYSSSRLPSKSEEIELSDPKPVVNSTSSDMFGLASGFGFRRKSISSDSQNQQLPVPPNVNTNIPRPPKEYNKSDLRKIMQAAQSFQGAPLDRLVASGELSLNPDPNLTLQMLDQDESDDEAGTIRDEKLTKTIDGSQSTQVRRNSDVSSVNSEFDRLRTTSVSAPRRSEFANIANIDSARGRTTSNTSSIQSTLSAHAPAASSTSSTVVDNNHKANKPFSTGLAEGEAGRRRYKSYSNDSSELRNIITPRRGGSRDQGATAGEIDIIRAASENRELGAKVNSFHRQHSRSARDPIPDPKFFTTSEFLDNI